VDNFSKLDFIRLTYMSFHNNVVKISQHFTTYFTTYFATIGIQNV